MVTVAFTLSDASWASVPVRSPVRLGCLGSMAAFITTVNVALWRKFSMKLPVESDGFSLGWGGSEDERNPLPRIFCIYWCAWVYPPW